MKNSLINQSFENAKKENRPALLTYTVAGDNTKKKSLEILKSISDYADICEVGFPHNTPIADGGQIQTSAYRAIKNGNLKNFLAVTPGIRMQQNDQDQKRSGSLFDAIQFGSDFVVIGRELTQAKYKDEVIHQFNSLIV